MLRIGLGIGVQVTAPLPLILGVVARTHAGSFRFNYILGEDGKPLFSEAGNTLIKES